MNLKTGVIRRRFSGIKKGGRAICLPRRDCRSSAHPDQAAGAAQPALFSSSPPVMASPEDPADEEQQHGKGAGNYGEEDDREPRAREDPGEEAQDQQREQQREYPYQQVTDPVEMVNPLPVLAFDASQPVKPVGAAHLENIILSERTGRW